MPDRPTRPEAFHYELPAELIAQRPLPERGASRLLHLAPDGAVKDLRFAQLASLLRPGDLLVLNDTRVLPARLLGRKASGGRVEVLLERRLGARLALAHLKASKSPAAGTELIFDAGVSARVLGRSGAFYLLRFSRALTPVLETIGHVPLPPYIGRADEPADRERYQTVFARRPGAVAAPTAGLHFDAAQLERLAAGGVEMAALTLHVGAGTFQPLREEQLRSGLLHAERFEVSPALVASVAAARARGGRIVAVGTTVVRALESAAADGELRPLGGETRLFIRPGYRFRIVDALLTNFHLPGSSLLMLVCAFAGHAPVMAAYAHAVRERYRFFSYGDAMFCHRADPGS
ncbi:MAG: tRNA preQ1(34) S-adenosylmethionine ribosyltransferase-isomerase QueA [Gammaproteobacteria bacterium]|nr:MAG: tRNA preQ1(34) S-adenosylmethionine ribosyltransferase-isomerase QueA [Gammaproteobacteria bacterium]